MERKKTFMKLTILMVICKLYEIEKYSMKIGEAKYLKQPRWSENEKRKVRNFKANVGV